jgi:hypothetical protein
MGRISLTREDDRGLFAELRLQIAGASETEAARSTGAHADNRNFSGDNVVTGAIHYLHGPCSAERRFIDNYFHLAHADET